MSTVTGQATGGMRWISINLQTRALRQAVSVVLFLLVTTLAQTVAKTNCTQPVETVMQTIRQRGRDAAAIHDILSRAHQQSPALLHAVLRDHIEELAEFVQGQGLDVGCQKVRWSALHISKHQVGRIAKLVAGAWHSVEEIELVTLSDGEHVGHVGDVGVWCAASLRIKAAVSAAMGGMNPEKVFPLVLDLGTDNPGMKHNHEYNGMRETRVRGSVAAKVWEETLLALGVSAPGVLVMYDSLLLCPDVRNTLEKNSMSMPLLNEALDTPPMLALSALLAVGRVHWKDPKDALPNEMWRAPVSTLQKERILLYGPSNVVSRIARLLVHAMESIGVPPSRARANIWLMHPDHGLLHLQSEREEHKTNTSMGTGMGTPVRRRARGRPKPLTIKENREEYHAQEAHAHLLPAALRGSEQNLATIVAELNITALIGASDRRGAFNHDTLRQMHKNTRHPVLISFSYVLGLFCLYTRSLLSI